jgi:hypothetical protein
LNSACKIVLKLLSKEYRIRPPGDSLYYDEKCGINSKNQSGLGISSLGYKALKVSFSLKSKDAACSTLDNAKRGMRLYLLFDDFLKVLLNFGVTHHILFYMHYLPKL